VSSRATRGGDLAWLAVLLCAGLATARSAYLPRPKVSGNRRFLVREDASPLFSLSDTVWWGPMRSRAIASGSGHRRVSEGRQQLRGERPGGVATWSAAHERRPWRAHAAPIQSSATPEASCLLTHRWPGPIGAEHPARRRATALPGHAGHSIALGGLMSGRLHRPLTGRAGVILGRGKHQPLSEGVTTGFPSPTRRAGFGSRCALSQHDTVAQPGA